VAREPPMASYTIEQSVMRAHARERAPLRMRCLRASDRSGASRLRMSQTMGLERARPSHHDVLPHTFQPPMTARVIGRASPPLLTWCPLCVRGPLAGHADHTHGIECHNPTHSACIAEFALPCPVHSSKRARADPQWVSLLSLTPCRAGRCGEDAR
jgi:hypothetical protein